jgi:hypothetical protein
MYSWWTSPVTHFLRMMGAFTICANSASHIALLKIGDLVIIGF